VGGREIGVLGASTRVARVITIGIRTRSLEVRVLWGGWGGGGEEEEEEEGVGAPEGEGILGK
jgi:hypothetical protein